MLFSVILNQLLNTVPLPVICDAMTPMLRQRYAHAVNKKATVALETTISTHVFCTMKWINVLYVSTHT